MKNSTIHELAEKLRNGEISATSLTQDYLARIDKIDKKINAYVHVCKDHALRQAEDVDKLFKKGTKLSPLAGIPMGLKDIFLTKNIPTTCASNILKNYIPPYNATVAEKLFSNNAILLGKHNMDEFAMGSSNENSIFGPVKNPWDLDATPGGSSGGSAASVASGTSVASLGTDTGGSIRLPASYCGCVGLKPTYGRVSRYGVIAFASSLDQVGPITKDVTDCAIMLNAIAGHDSNDSTSFQLPVPDYTKTLVNDKLKLKVGIPKEYFEKGIDPEVEKAVNDAIAKIKELGATCEKVSLPHTKYAVPTYYIIAPAEASANLARYDGVRYGLTTKEAKDLKDLYLSSRTKGFGKEVTLRIILGTYVLSSGYYDAFYRKAMQARTLIRRDFEDAFSKVDVIISPVCPTAAFKIGERIDDPLKLYLADIYTIPCNLAGLPGMSIPCGFTKKGLPIGLQIMGKPLGEETMLKLAYTYEQNTEWHKRVNDYLMTD